MNKIQQNHKSMFNAVSDSFKKYGDVLNTNPAIASNLVVFDQRMNQLENLIMLQAGHAVGRSELKQKEEAEMIQETIQIAAILYVYAIDNNLPELQAKVSISPSMLQNMSAEQLKATCLNIHALAEEHVDVFENYGSTPEKVDDLKKEIDDFVEVISAPRSAIVTRSQATYQMKVVFAEINELLKNKIDKLMLLFEQSHPEVYRNYKSARIIVDLSKAQKQEVEEEFEQE